MEKINPDLTVGMNNLKVDDAAADRKILIAVDFGTTFSGVAWAQTRRVDHHVSTVELSLLMLLA